MSFRPRKCYSCERLGTKTRSSLNFSMSSQQKLAKWVLLLMVALLATRCNAQGIVYLNVSHTGPNFWDGHCTADCPRQNPCSVIASDILLRSSSSNSFQCTLVIVAMTPYIYLGVWETEIDALSKVDLLHITFETNYSFGGQILKVYCPLVITNGNRYNVTGSLCVDFMCQIQQTPSCCKS